MPTSRRASRNGLTTIGASRPRSTVERCRRSGIRALIEISIFAPAIAAGIGVVPDRLRDCIKTHSATFAPGVLALVARSSDRGDASLRETGAGPGA
jgi:hypothetical protein